LILINEKNIIVEAKNKPILDNKLIKNTCEKPKASNHKKSVYKLTKVDINIKAIIVNHTNKYPIVFIGTGYHYWLLKFVINNN
jgi:hypothetical protein